MDKRALRRVYIASPYRKGDMAMNVKFQLDCSDELIELGYYPYTPLLSHFQKISSGRDDKYWIELDLAWVEVCDIVLRLGGESDGADGEVAHAIKFGIPVVYSVGELLELKLE